MTMTDTTTTIAKPRIDWTAPVLWLFALVLVGLILLPLSWLAVYSLTDRERHIIVERRLVDEPKTLEDLSAKYGISRERVRQIEVRAFDKLQKAMKNMVVEAASAASRKVEAHAGRTAAKAEAH